MLLTPSVRGFRGRGSHVVLGHVLVLAGTERVGDGLQEDGLQRQVEVSPYVQAHELSFNLLTPTYLNGLSIVYTVFPLGRKISSKYDIIRHQTKWVKKYILIFNSKFKNFNLYDIK